MFLSISDFQRGNSGKSSSHPWLKPNSIQVKVWWEGQPLIWFVPPQAPAMRATENPLYTLGPPQNWPACPVQAEAEALLLASIPSSSPEPYACLLSDCHAPWCSPVINLEGACQRCCFPKVTFCYCIQTQVPLIPKPKLKPTVFLEAERLASEFSQSSSVHTSLLSATPSYRFHHWPVNTGSLRENVLEYGKGFWEKRNSHISHAFRNYNNPTGQNQQLWNLKEASIPLGLISIADFTDRSFHWSPSEAVVTRVTGCLGKQLVLHIVLIKSVLRCAR